MRLSCIFPLVLSTLPYSFSRESRYQNTAHDRDAAFFARHKRCVVNPNDPSQTFVRTFFHGTTPDDLLTNAVKKLLDPANGIPIISNGSEPSRAQQVMQKVPRFHFSKVPNASGTYDLMLGSQYVGLTTSGQVIFVNSSTGLGYTTSHGQTYTTPVFSVTCDGQLHMVAPSGDTTPVAVSDGRLHARSLSSSLTVLSPQHPPLLAPRRPSDDDDEEDDDEDDDDEDEEDEEDEDEHARCELDGQIPSKRPDAQKPYSDGCGTKEGIAAYVPDLEFGDCCNAHDMCYQTCGRTFEECNDSFGQCMHAQCDKSHQDDDGMFEGVKHWGCGEAADLYQGAVETFGSGAFEDSTADQCDCKCPKGQADCDNGCCSAPGS